MSNPENQPAAAQPSPLPPDSDRWRPPVAERRVVAVMGGVLAGALAFGIVFGMLSRKEVGKFWTGQPVYADANPLERGLIAGGMCFLIVAGCIYLFTASRIWSGLYHCRVEAICAGVVAALFGFLPGFEMVGDVLMKAGQGGNDDRTAALAAHERAGRGVLAGFGTAGGCGGFAGVSVFKLYERSTTSSGQSKREDES